MIYTTNRKTIAKLSFFNNGNLQLTKKFHDVKRKGRKKKIRQNSCRKISKRKAGR